MADMVIICISWIATCTAVVVALFKIANPLFPFLPFVFPFLLSAAYIMR